MTSVVERLNAMEEVLEIEDQTQEESDFKESVLRILEALIKKPAAKKATAKKK